jgi:hypothetical protein
MTNLIPIPISLTPPIVLRPSGISLTARNFTPNALHRIFLANDLVASIATATVTVSGFIDTMSDANGNFDVIFQQYNSQSQAQPYGIAYVNNLSAGIYYLSIVRKDAAYVYIFNNVNGFHTFLVYIGDNMGLLLIPPISLRIKKKKAKE